MTSGTPAQVRAGVRWAIDPTDERTVYQVSPFIPGDIVCRAPAPAYDESYAAWPSRAPLIAAAPALYQALAKLLDRYVRLVESGDAGNWDAEKEAEVIEARALLSGVSP